MRKASFIKTLLVVGFSAVAVCMYAQPRIAPTAYGGSVKVNYVRTWDSRVPHTNASTILPAASADSFLMSTQYFNGLGQPLQTVVKKGSSVTNPSDPTSLANAVDLVSAVVYDEFGREQYKYLPFGANSTGGNTSISDGYFKLNPFQQDSTFLKAQYAGENYFYSQVFLEPSPLNRPLESFAPGDSWVGTYSQTNANNRRSIKTSYLFNAAADSVRLWIAGSTPATVPTTAATYGAGELFKTVSSDEGLNQIIEYRDKQEKVILKKVQLSASPGSAHVGWLCTYYIYDDLGNLRFVLQPKAVESLLEVGNCTITTAIRDELCFYYGFDAKNRLIVKKVPGAGEVRMVYDQWDRLVLTQDANLRTTNKWIFTKYDQLNRVIMTGFYVNSTDTTQASMQSYLNAQGLARYESYQTATFPLYSLNLTFPSVSYSDVLTITYYDEYSWAGWYGSYSSKDNTWDSEFATASNSTWPYPQPLAQSSQTRGFVTGVWDKTSGGLLTATYYDDQARVVQTKSYNYSGGIDIHTTQYSFSGQVLQTVLRHQKAGTNAQTHTVQTRLSYDKVGRLIKTEKKLSSTIGSTNLSEDWHTTATLEYDALGQIKKKTLAPHYGTSGLDTLANLYNIRGWLTEVNKGYIAGTHDAWFGMQLGYDKDGYATFTKKQYNGNISATIWRTRGDGEHRKYDFDYDAANRLLKADFTQRNGSNWDISAGIDFSIKMGDGSDPLTAYDANGNIKKMWQRGWKLGGSVTIDSLIYKSDDYSNKLKYVRDGANDPQSKLSDFKESSQNNSDNLNSNTADYSYDVNGNLTVDNNKSISSITYNHLNLPTNIAVTGKGSIEYVYDNAGTKLKKIVHETNKPDKTTLYLGGFVYENDTLQLLHHEEGRIRLTVDTGNAYTGYAFDYFEKDHLGNVRVVLTEQRDTAAYPEASMETAKLGRDTLYYSKISETRVDRTTVSGYPTNDSYTNPNDFVAKTNGNGNKIGPGIVLKVMAGDKFNLRVSSWYKLNGATPGTPVSPVNDLVAALIAGIGGSGKFGATELQSGTVLSDNVSDFLFDQGYISGRPKAYVNWILFNEQLMYDSSSSGFQQVPDESVYGNGGSNPSVHVHQQSNLSLSKSGYLYVYVSNETPNIDVFFDNLQVTHVRGPLREETHYYPFGLTMTGISYKTALPLENKFRFGDKEVQEKEFTDGVGLDWADFGARMYDHQIGKWHVGDPLAEHTMEWSPFNYGLNNPLKFIDEDGLEATHFAAGGGGGGGGGGARPPRHASYTNYTAHRRMYRETNGYVHRAAQYRTSSKHIANQSAGSAATPAPIYEQFRPGTGDQWTGPFVTKGNRPGLGAVHSTKLLGRLHEYIKEVRLGRMGESNGLTGFKTRSVVDKIVWTNKAAEQEFKQAQAAYNDQVRLIRESNQMPDVPGAGATKAEIQAWFAKVQDVALSINLQIAALGPSPEDALIERIERSKDFKKVSTSVQELPTVGPKQN